jgi:hypothetical protein
MSYIKNIENLLTLFKSDPLYFIEISIGTQQDNMFVNGVEYEYIYELLRVFGETKWTSQSKLSDPDHHINFYLDDISGFYNGYSKPTFIKKKIINSVNIHCSIRDYSININLIKKEVCPNYIFKETPQFATVNQSWSFNHKHNWNYTLSKVGSGINKTKASNSLPTFNINLELIKNTNFEKQTSSAKLAENIHLKCKQLLGNYTLSNTLLNFNLIEF